jgi:hypothetical protein
MGICCEYQGIEDPTRSRIDSSVAFAWVLYFLHRCSLSQGLEHRKAGVIISRQMNPKPR